MHNNLVWVINSFIVVFGWVVITIMSSNDNINGWPALAAMSSSQNPVLIEDRTTTSVKFGNPWPWISDNFGTTNDLVSFFVIKNVTITWNTFGNKTFRTDITLVVIVIVVCAIIIMVIIDINVIDINISIVIIIIIGTVIIVVVSGSSQCCCSHCRLCSGLFLNFNTSQKGRIIITESMFKTFKTVTMVQFRCTGFDVETVLKTRCGGIINRFSAVPWFDHIFTWFTNIIVTELVFKIAVSTFFTMFTKWIF